MLDGPHVWRIWSPVMDINVLLTEEVHADPGNMWASIVRLKHHMVKHMLHKQHDDGSEYLVPVPLPVQVAFNE